MATFITDANLKLDLAAWYKETGAELPDGVDQYLGGANQSAYDEILSRLGARGYTLAQIITWSRAVEFNRDIGLFWSLVNGANLSADDLWVNKLDRRAELDTVWLKDSDGEDIVLGDTSNRMSRGALDTTDDLYTMDTQW